MSKYGVISGLYFPAFGLNKDTFHVVYVSVSNSHFSSNLNDEEMITSHLMCVMKQLSYDKNIMFERKKTATEKPWQNMLHKIEDTIRFKWIIKSRNYLPLVNLSLRC